MGVYGEGMAEQGERSSFARPSIPSPGRERKRVSIILRIRNITNSYITHLLYMSRHPANVNANRERHIGGLARLLWRRTVETYPQPQRRVLSGETKQLDGRDVQGSECVVTVYDYSDERRADSGVEAVTASRQR